MFYQSIEDLVRAIEEGSYDAKPSKLRQGSGTFLHDDGSPLTDDEIEAVYDEQDRGRVRWHTKFES